MNSTSSAYRPFASPEEFVAVCKLNEFFEQWAASVRRRSALFLAGFRLERTEHVPEHRMTILKGSRPLVEEPRTTRRIKQAILTSFQHEGLRVRSDLVSIYWGQTRVWVHIAVLENP
jgi:hypothetical protein